MGKIKDNLYEAEYLEMYNYEETSKNLKKVFDKYRNYKNKEEIIRRRYKASLSLDNLGIFSSYKSDPVQNKVLQLERYTNYISLIDQIYEINSNDLSKDEKIIYKKMLISKHNDEDVMEYLNISSKAGLYARKKSCFIKVAMWYDLEVFMDSEEFYD